MDNTERRYQTVAMSTGRRRTALASPERADHSTPATAGGWGLAFVVLLLLSAGMASTPAGREPTGTVRDFYTVHSGVVVAAQVVGLLAAATFVPFVLTLRSTPTGQTMGALEVAGLGVAAAAALTAVPVLWLAAVATSGADGFVHGLAVASDLSDVLLFATIALWATAALGAAMPLWFKTLAAAVGLLAVARAFLLLVGSDLLEVVAPLSFVVLVTVLSTLVLVRRSPLRRP